MALIEVLILGRKKSNESHNFGVIFELLQIVQLVPPLRQKRAGNQVEPRCHAWPILFSLAYEKLELVPIDVLDGLDLVPVGVEGEVRPQEEDVVDLVLAPFSVGIGRIDDAG